MGQLVSLADYREKKRKEAEAAAQAELDALREIVTHGSNTSVSPKASQSWSLSPSNSIL